MHLKQKFVTSQLTMETTKDKKSTKQLYSYSLFQIKKSNPNYSWDVYLYENKIDNRDRMDNRITNFILDNNLQVPEKYFRKVDIEKYNLYSKEPNKGKVSIR